MIDLHCHILPGVDDGPRTMEEAIALSQAMVDNGITVAVTTTHVQTPRWDNTRSSLIKSFDLFRSVLSEAGIPLDVHLGAEVRVSFDVVDLLERNEIPFLGFDGTHHVMLLEFPDSTIPPSSLEFAQHLLVRRIRPLIAHPERNPVFQSQFDRLLAFLNLGCWTQVTAGSLLGEFGRAAKKTAWDLMERDWVNIVATDAHSVEYRPPRLREAVSVIKERFDEGYAEYLTVDMPKRILGMS